VRRYVPELAGVEGGAVHEPWLLPEPVRRTLRYESHGDFVPLPA
jgi:deoxyribodipyrimidine photo-lyase